MADQPPAPEQPAKPANDKAGPDKPARRASVPDMSWRPRSARAAGAQNGARGKQFGSVMLAGLLMALITVTIVWFFFIGSVPKEAYYLTINIGQYNAKEYPVVPFSRQDSERLKRNFTRHHDAESKTLGLLKTKLNELAEQHDAPLLVHITALALVRNNQVYLLPVVADPDDLSTWLPVQSVFDALERCKVPRLLILDLAHPMADPRLGVLSERVAETLEAQLKKAPPGFLVLCPCSSGQTALASEVLQGSVFAYYLDMGLQGHADGWGAGGKVDRRIMARELCAYVENRVQNWASGNRRQRQTPAVFGKGEDFPILLLPGEHSPAEYPVTPRSWPEALQKEWQKRDDWFNRRLFVTAPNAYRRRESELLRQELRWQGGVDPGFSELADLSEDKQRSFPVMSLAMECRQVKKNADLDKFLSGMIAKAAGTDDVAKMREALDGKDSKFKDLDYNQKAWAILEALSQARLSPTGPGNLSEAQVRLAAGLLQPADHEFVETLYLQELANYAERLRSNSYKWRADYVPFVVQAMRARERLLAGLSDDPALLPWVVTYLDSADVQRRQGEKVLLCDPPGVNSTAWEKATVLLENARGEYQQASMFLDTLKRSRNTLDDALGLLPAYRMLLSEWPERDPPAEETWKLVVEYTGKLAASFAPGRRLGPAELKNLADDLKSQESFLDQYLRDLRKVLGKRLDVKGGGPDAMEQLLSVLRCAAPTAADRARLYPKALELAQKLQSQTDREDKAATPATRGSAPASLLGWDPLEQAKLRARLARDVLRLAGADNLSNVDEALQSARIDDLDPLELALQTAWSAKKPQARSKTSDRDYIDWLERNYSAESKHWRGVQSADSMGLSEFYAKKALKLPAE